MVYCTQQILGVTDLTDTEKITVWGIHSKDDSILLNQNIIAIGWGSMGDLSQIAGTREDRKSVV